MNNLEQFLNELVKEKAIPGATYSLIVKNNVYMGVVGNKSLFPHIEKNNLNTLYDLASLTKVVVTNTIIGRMLMNKKIKLKDKVSFYLKKFKYKYITIYDLLTHSSGLPASLDLSKIKNKQQLIDEIYNVKLKYKTGTDVVYSDIGFILLGFIIEKIYSLSLDEIAKIEVFEPLKMNNTCYNPNNKDLCAPTEYTFDRGLVRGVVHDKKAYYLNGIAGHAGVFSNVCDLTNFCKMVLNNGVFNNKKYLSKKIIDSWFIPYSKQKINNKYRSIGWIVGQNKDITGENYTLGTITHAGFTGTSILIDRVNKMASILLTNRVHPIRTNNKLSRRRNEFIKICYNIQRGGSNGIKL